jgi:hypothetical protein
MPPVSKSLTTDKRGYSITSSARSRNDSGIVSPSVLAVFRLTTSWYLVGSCTGSSRSSTWLANWRCQLSIRSDSTPRAAAWYLGLVLYTTPFRYLFCFVLAAVAQTPQDRPRAAAAATDRLTHRSERLKRAPVDSVRQFLAAHLPPPRMRPVIDLRRAQHLGAARYEGAPDAHLNRTAAFGWRRRSLTKVRVVGPFHGSAGMAPDKGKPRQRGGTDSHCAHHAGRLASAERVRMGRDGAKGERRCRIIMKRKRNFQQRPQVRTRDSRHAQPHVRQRSNGQPSCQKP